MHIQRSRGFTLIELLVVIAIIGILSAVVLASLNTARTKGNDAAVQSDLSTVQTEAEIQYGSLGNTYTGTTISGDCSAVTTNGSLMADTVIQNAIKGAKSAEGGNAVDCGITASAYSFAVPLASGGAWCIDSTGVARKATQTGTAYTAVSGAATAAHTAAGQTTCN